MSEQQSTMRDLLARWAAVEPERLKNLYDQAFRFDMGEYDHSIYFLYDDLSPIDLAWIQWATQQAIIARGWSFELSYNPDASSNLYEATVDSNKSGGWEFGNDGFVAPLLDAYLHTLEGEGVSQ